VTRGMSTDVWCRGWEYSGPHLDERRRAIARMVDKPAAPATARATAGIRRAAPTLQVTEEHWDAVMNINAKAVFFAPQAVLPMMIAQQRGVIVRLASMAGKIGSRTTCHTTSARPRSSA
jgi:NADP-dependent 3-hydroxy acid dehydrogenase YdfG